MDAGLDLPDGTAGMACKRDADCARGYCTSVLHILTATDATDAPGGYCTKACETDSQCGGTGECSVPEGEEQGECLSRCQEDAECRPDYRCVGGGQFAGIRVSGTCQPEPETEQLEDGVVGEACRSNADCPGGHCTGASQLGTRLPGNYCTARCLEDSACGEGGRCLVFAGSSSAGECFASCASDADCAREGYRCRRLGPGFDACSPAATALPDNSAGRACEDDLACGGNQGSCAAELPFVVGGYDLVPAPGGYCTQECDLDADCGARGQCISRGPKGGMCLGNCETDAHCRAGYSCVLHLRDHNGTDRVCAPLPP